MKLFHLVVTLTTLLNVSWAFDDSEGKEALKCYDTFVPLNNGLAVQAKQLSEHCSNDAEAKLELLTQKEREEAMLAVDKTKNSLNSCTSGTDNLEFLKCLSRIVDENKSNLQQISKLANDILNDKVDEAKGIKQERLVCFEQVIVETIRKSDVAFGNLKTCVASGEWPRDQRSQCF